MYGEQRNTLITADEFVRESEPWGWHETTSLQPEDKGEGIREDTAAKAARYLTPCMPQYLVGASPTCPSILSFPLSTQNTAFITAPMHGRLE
jgi:hypothetical protein